MPSKKFSVQVVFGVALQPLGVTSTGVRVLLVVELRTSLGGKGVFVAVDSKTKHSSCDDPQPMADTANIVRMTVFIPFDRANLVPG